MSVKSRVQELNTRLAEKLTNKGVEADGTETTTALIDKVDRIITGETDIEHYTGAYEVTPQKTKQVLPTAEKFMNNDVTVKATPYHEVENTQGGTTAIIGG